MGTGYWVLCTVYMDSNDDLDNSRGRDAVQGRRDSEARLPASSPASSHATTIPRMLSGVLRNPPVNGAQHPLGLSSIAHAAVRLAST